MSASSLSDSLSYLSFELIPSWNNIHDTFPTRTTPDATPACNAHASYYIVICGLFVSTDFYTLSNIRHGLGKTVLSMKYVF